MPEIRDLITFEPDLTDGDHRAMIPHRTAILAIAMLAFAGPLAAQTPAPAQVRTSPPAGANAPDPAGAAFTAWDKDRNGNLSRQEFQEGWRQLRQVAEVEARLRAQFQAIDANRNNAIDANEYPNLVLVKNAGKSAPPLSSFDANGNQRLEFGEYVALVRKLSPPPPPPPKRAPAPAPGGAK